MLVLFSRRPGTSARRGTAGACRLRQQYVTRSRLWSTAPRSAPTGPHLSPQHPRIFRQDDVLLWSRDVLGVIATRARAYYVIITNRHHFAVTSLNQCSVRRTHRSIEILNIRASSECKKLEENQRRLPRVGIVRGSNPQFMSTDAHSWVKISFKFQSLGKISNISTSDPSPSSFRSIPTACLPRLRKPISLYTFNYVRHFELTRIVESFTMCFVLLFALRI